MKKYILYGIHVNQLIQVMRGDISILIDKDVPEDWKFYLNGIGSKPEPIQVLLCCSKAAPQITYNGIGHLNGNVIVEFTLDEVTKFDGTVGYPDIYTKARVDDLYCIDKYGYGLAKELYAWHINRKIIYSTPVPYYNYELYGGHVVVENCIKKRHGECNAGLSKNKYIGCAKAILAKVPLSWIYVQNIKEHS